MRDEWITNWHGCRKKLSRPNTAQCQSTWLEGMRNLLEWRYSQERTLASSVHRLESSLSLLISSILLYSVAERRTWEMPRNICQSWHPASFSSRPAKRARARTRIQICDTYCFSTATIIRWRASMLRYTHIVCLELHKHFRIYKWN
jgi:hypothetical protein